MPQTVEKIISSSYKAGYKGYGLPSQTVSLEEKESEEWGQACMDFFRDEARMQSREKFKDLRKYQMLDDEFKYPSNYWLTDPLNLGDKKEELYGAVDDIQHYPIINSPLNTILGERINRPVQFYCLSDSSRSRNDYQDVKGNMLLEYVMQQKMNKIYSRMERQGIPLDEKAQQQAQAMLPEEIQDYVDKDYVDVVESVSNRILKNLWKTSNLDFEFVEGFRHSTICGKEFYSMDVVNGKLKIKNRDPFSVFYHKSPSLHWISEGQFAGYRVMLTPSSVIDMYRDKLKVSDIEALEAKLYPTQGKAGGNQSLTGIKSIDYNTSVFADWQGTTFNDINRSLIDQMVDDFQMTGNTGYYRSMHGFVEVVQAYWKSYRKIGILTWYDDQDNEHFDQVDENYTPDEDAGESIKWFYLNQVYEGTIIDESIYVGIQPYQHQIFDPSNPDYSPLPIEGSLTNNFNGKTIAITDLMLPWAELYDIVAHELKRDMKKAYGKVMYMNIEGIPDVEGFDMDKWMYWAREFGIAWVDGSKKSGFSHYQSADMSFAEIMTARMNMLDKIKMNCDMFAGFSQPRLANTSREETAQQSQMSVMASVNQTEYFFWKHTQCIQRVLSIAINICKKLLKGTSYLRNLYDDLELRYIEVEADKIHDENLNVFVVHGSQEITRREAVRQMAMSAAGKQGDPVDMADLMLANTETEIRKIMKDLRKKSQEMAERQSQIEQAQIDAENQRHAEEMEFKREDLYETLDSQERQAYIRTFAFQKDNLKDGDGSKIPDILEYQRFFEEHQDNLRKHDREREKSRNDYELKRRELKLKEREVSVKEDAIQERRENQKNDLLITKIQARSRPKK